MIHAVRKADRRHSFMLLFILADNTKRNQMEPVEEKKAQKSEEYIADSMPEEILP